LRRPHADPGLARASARPADSDFLLVSHGRGTRTVRAKGGIKRINELTIS
jgi:hypothetical protein